MPRLALLTAASAALLAGCGADPGPAAEAHAPRPAAVPVSLPPDTTAADTTDERADLPDGFVRLSEAAPEVAQEVRYTTAYNFVGEPIDGYAAPECVLAERAAEALRRVAADLARDGLGLKVYDCYRPQTAVDHFRRWVWTEDEAMKAAFYPEVPKNELFRRGYIAGRSGHSRGATVDLTLVRLPAAAAVRTAFPDPAGPLPRCDRPLADGAGGRLPEGDLDMGTAYDCLSPLAATASPDVGPDARRNRLRLRDAMSRRGFRNYSKEWWHYTLRDEPHPSTYFDFPVE